MNIYLQTTFARARAAAFTTVEILVSLGVAGLLFVSLYGGFSSGWMITELARENLRATHIMVEKMETLRLFTWTDLRDIPDTFVVPYFPQATNEADKGLSYTGTVSITDAPLSEAYNKHLKMVTLNLRWVSGSVEHSRQMTTFVSQYGLQNYVY